MRLITDIFDYCTREAPRWNTISVSGYHMREAGCTAAQEVGFTLAHAIAYVEAALAAGGLPYTSCITPLRAVRAPALPEPPARQEMVGPLLVYAVWGGPRYVAGGEGLEAFALGSDVEAVSTWRGMIYDEGTRRTWKVLEDQYHFSWYGSAWGDWDAKVRAAREGLVTGGPEGTRYVAPDGQSETLLTDYWPAQL